MIDQELADEIREYMLAQGATEQELASMAEEIRVAEYRFRTWDERMESARG